MRGRRIFCFRTHLEKGNKGTEDNGGCDETLRKVECQEDMENQCRLVKKGSKKKEEEEEE